MQNAHFYKWAFFFNSCTWRCGSSFGSIAFIIRDWTEIEFDRKTQGAWKPMYL
ncbi:hypothetical protein CPter291_0191 [Collimonas pratensis]|uniref:Uncharacterized protein n=1 Tax=Collimonas pratensis TaxID=279113 RepID=A0ABN4MAB9_9BURK|nr:hypothetical protein CPter291_0191 [Collimonas pratensis]